MKYRKQMWNAWVIGAALACLAAAVGCGEKAAETAAEKAIESEAAKNGEKVDVQMDLAEGTMNITGENGEKISMKMDAESGTMTVTSEDGEKVDMKMDVTDQGASMTGADGSQMLTGNQAKLPEDFPEDVPQYKGMKLVMVTKTPDGNHSVTATTPDAADKVAADLKKQAEANGWNEEASMDMGEMLTLQYAKDDRGLSIMIMKNEGETGIQMTIVNE